MKTLKARHRFIGIFALLPMLFAGGALGKIAPDLGRSTFHTDHFRIHYPPHYQIFAEALSDRLEDAFRILTLELRWVPKGRIDVVVRGDTDVANGFAEVFPYNRLVLNAVPPEPWGFFSESDDWIRTLAIHELTHIIANDESSGFPKFMRAIIGTAAKTNPYQPAWLVEGLAVYEETTKTSRGRGRSVWNETIVRTALDRGLIEEKWRAADQELQVTLDRLNDGIRAWPGGNASYLYGYLLTEGMATRSGLDAPAQISLENAATLPFFIESVAHDRLGTGYPDLWRETIERLRVRNTADCLAISRELETPLSRLTATGRRTRGMAAEGPDRIYFIRDSERDGTGLSVLERGSVENLSYWRWDGGTRIRMTADHRFLVYSRNVPYLEHSLFSDLFIFDLRKYEETQITFGARAADPELSSDFEWDLKSARIKRGFLFFVKNSGDANQSISALSSTPEGTREAVLYAGRDFERLGAPAGRTLSGKTTLAFSVKGLHGGERIRSLEFHPGLPSDGVRDIFPAANDRQIAATPEWDFDGSLLFTGAAGGVFNLNRISSTEPTKKNPDAERLTNFRTGGLQPTRPYPTAPLYALAYGPSGWNLATVETGNFSAAGPGVSNLEWKLGKKFAAPSGARLEFIDAPAATREAASYSVFPALWPKYWAPDVRKVEDGWTLGVQTANYDPWESHHYRIFAGGDTRARFPIWDLNYQFDGFYPTLELSVKRSNNYFATYGESNQIDTDAANVYMPAGWDSSMLLGFTSSTSRLFSEKESTGGFEFGWVLDHMRTYDDSIDTSGESGIRGRAVLTGYFVGKERFSSVDSRIDLRIPSPIRRHFFRLSANYSAANNERVSALYFLGGGESTIGGDGDLLLRGYPQGTIFGRKILTSNFEYLFPVADVFRGFGTFPAYFQSSRMKLFFDVGSAESIGNDEGNFNRWPNATGIQLLNDFNFFYRVPVTVALGFDYGLARDLGGERRVVFGLFSRLK